MKRFSKRSRAAWLLLPALLAVPLWMVKQKREQSTNYILSRYPQTRVLKRVQQDHSEFVRETGGRILGLYATWIEKDEIISACRIPSSMDSEIETYQLTPSIYNTCFGPGCAQFSTHHAESGYHSKTMTNVQRQAITRLLQHMPSNTLPTKSHNLMVITFCVNKDFAENRQNRYQTRIYDRAHLPPQVREIYRITGAPRSSHAVGQLMKQQKPQRSSLRRFGFRSTHAP